MRELAGRAALVTGAAGGIGRHIARALAAEGMAVGVSGRNAQALDELRDELRSTGAHAESVVCDLAEREQLRGLVPQAESALGPVDVLVNNAGIEIVSGVLDVTEEQIDAIVATNLVAPMLLIRAALPGMLERGRGHVVSIASLSGKLGIACNEHYGATKAALIRFTYGLRAEFRRAPVGFSVVSPGFTAAGMFERIEQESGVRASRLQGVTRPEKVAAGVVRAIRDDLPDVTVNQVPLSPLFALESLIPRAFERVAWRVGPQRLFERVAELRR